MDCGRTQAKARPKREKADQQERELELERQREDTNARPSWRQIKLVRIQQQLTPFGLENAEIPSDGYLYSVVVSPAAIPITTRDGLDQKLLQLKEKCTSLSYMQTLCLVLIFLKTLCPDMLLNDEADFASLL